jgi:hypothetical protein
VAGSALFATLVESWLGRSPEATHAGRNLAVTLLPLVLLVAVSGGKL